MGYKVSIHKSMTFLYTYNELLGREAKKTIPFTIPTKKKKKKDLGIDLTKEVKDLYSENYRTLKKKIH